MNKKPRMKNHATDALPRIRPFTCTIVGETSDRRCCMPASLIILIAMTVGAASLAVYRRIVIRSEDDTLHIADPSGELISGQQEMARKLTKIDRLGIGLTIATVVYGMALFAMFLYRGLMGHTLG